MTIIQKQLQDLTRLQWSTLRRSSGTGGTFLKSSENRSGKKWYYKLSCFDAERGIVGHECVNEIIADRLLTILKIDHLHYDLIHATVDVEERTHDTWLCRSEDFKRPEESKLALDMFYQLERRAGESPLEFCIRQGWEQQIWEMLIVDFLILNRDRHGANMEVLRDRESKSVRLAPLFDHGLSFFFSTYKEKDITPTDELTDLPVQCFVGGRSTLQNLNLIPKEQRRLPQVLKKEDRERLFLGLEDAMSPRHQEAVWQMLWTRWEYYESLCHQR